jgi:hypothetical protein
MTGTSLSSSPVNPTILAEANGDLHRLLYLRFVEGEGGDAAGHRMGISGSAAKRRFQRFSRKVRRLQGGAS